MGQARLVARCRQRFQKAKDANEATPRTRCRSRPRNRPPRDLLQRSREQGPTTSRRPPRLHVQGRALDGQKAGRRTPGARTLQRIKAIVADSPSSRSDRPTCNRGKQRAAHRRRVLDDSAQARSALRVHAIEPGVQNLDLQPKLGTAHFPATCESAGETMTGASVQTSRHDEADYFHRLEYLCSLRVNCAGQQEGPARGRFLRSRS